MGRLPLAVNSNCPVEKGPTRKGVRVKEVNWALLLPFSFHVCVCVCKVGQVAVKDKSEGWSKVKGTRDALTFSLLTLERL